jgi:hypothetical protein
MTDSERVVKARRLDPKQLAPVKKNLAFLIKAMLGKKMLEPHQVRLDVFTQEKICQQLNTFLEEREVGASRIYALMLLIKKVLVFLASSESARRREYIQPNTWNSWTCVDSICSDSNTRRKQISQNRKLLGAEQSKKLAMEQAPTRMLPTADDLRMPALFGGVGARARRSHVSRQRQRCSPREGEGATVRGLHHQGIHCDDLTGLRALHVEGVDCVVVQHCVP